MRHSRLLLAASLVAALAPGCSGRAPVSVLPATTSPSTASALAARSLRAPLGPTSIVASAGERRVELCAPSSDAAHAACLGTVRASASLTAAFPDSVNGLTPNDLASIYGYPAPAAQGFSIQTIGVVVAFDDPRAEADLDVYRAYFGLPPCPAATGCFRKIALAGSGGVGATGAPNSITAHPAASVSGWNAESEADIEVASAVCPRCRIVLAEAASDRLSDLGSAVQAAVAAGATVVSASFGAPESVDQLPLVGAFSPGPVKVVAAAGDGGRGVLFPAAAPAVIAVAGTTLAVSGTTVTESLWSGSGGGCSAVFARLPVQPAWCPRRSVADLAVVADPNTGVAFFDANFGGWGIVGGTSVSAAAVAAMFSLSGDTFSGSGAQQLYAGARRFAPITGGGTIAGLGAPLNLAAF